MKPRGFTLIELLVVVAILGILASVVLLSFRGTREDARATSTEQFASQLDRGLGAYIAGRWDSDGNANDSSGYGNHGAVNGATPTADRNGQSNKAYSFDGTNDVIQITSSLGGPLDFNQGGKITVAFWLKMDSYPSSIREPTRQDNGAFYVSWRGDLGSPEWELGIFTSSVDNVGNVGDGDILSSDIPQGVWTHVVVTADGANVRRYINGVQHSSALAYDGTLRTPGGGEIINIGAGANLGGANRYCPCDIDDYRLYNRALSVAEIQQYYAAAAAKHRLASKKDLLWAKRGNIVRSQL